MRSPACVQQVGLFSFLSLQTEFDGGNPNQVVMRFFFDKQLIRVTDRVETVRYTAVSLRRLD
jgi:hypothetical protein